MPHENAHNVPAETPRELTKEERLQRDTEVIRAQMAILETIKSEAERLAWNVAHAETFRELWDNDPDFRHVAVARDVAEMLQRIAVAERSKRS